jgi:hypothetical protein
VVTRQPPRGVLTAALVAAIVLALFAAGAGSARRASPAHAPAKCISDVPLHNGRPIFPELRRLGVRVWTTGISWAEIAPRRPKRPRSPNDPAYRWPRGFGHVLDLARAQGIEPVLHVNDFPAWSNGGRTPSWAPKNPRDYANFMAAAVRRYPQVRRWSVIMEPTDFRNLQPQGDRRRPAPRIYARILDAAYAAMHAARRNVVVIGGNVQPSGHNDKYVTAPDVFIRNMVLPSGRRPRLDMFGINPYTERRLDLALRHLPNRVDFNDLDWLAHDLDRYWPHGHLRMFVAEFGWNTEHEGQGWLYVVPRTKQAADLATAYRLAATQRRVDTFCWFLLYDSPANLSGGHYLNWTSGLRTSTGEKKPAWEAFARARSGRSRY